MSLTLHLKPILEQRLRLEAEQRGVPLEMWLVQELEQRFQTDTTDTDLIERITAGLPEAFWVRYRDLIQKRDLQTLSKDEQLELIGLSDQTEALTLQRTQALVELSKRQNLSIDALRVRYGLRPMPVQS